jgi:hypothetical protein
MTLSLNTEIPAAPRIYEYLSGGTFHFPADRAVGEHMISLVPALPKWLRLLRAFLQKAASVLEAEGITHFVDFGSGLPSESHIHAALHGAKVVYVDADPNVVAEGKRMLAGRSGAIYLEGDVREPLKVLDSPAVREHLGGARRVGFGLSGVSVFFSPAEMNKIFRDLHAWAAPGSRVYTNFETKDPALMTDKLQQFVDDLTAAGGAYRFYSVEDCRSVGEPWELDSRGLVPLAEFLEAPPGTIGAVDREDVNLEIFAAIYEKRG